jgi:1,2-diacylglycerol 3-beta-glucosyltransferase
VTAGWLLALPPLAHLLFGVWVAWYTWQRRQTEAPATVGSGAAMDTAPPAASHIACLVAARNEEDNIDDCLEALAAQSVALHLVVINDHSSDETSRCALNWESRFGDRLSVIEGGPGKARALQAGLESLVPEVSVVLTCDADCTPPPDWAESMAAELTSSRLAALGGCTAIRVDGPSASVEALDWAILLATAAALSDSGRPLTAMGNNMALDRQRLEAVGGFLIGAESVTEDYILFRELGRDSPTAVRMERRFLNWTEPLRSLAGLFRQRRRWAIGAADGRAVNVAILIGSTAAYGLPWVLLWYSPGLAVALILARWAIQWMIGRGVERRMGIDLPLWWVPVHDLVLSVYGVLVPLSIPFSRRTRWKGRTLAEGSG